MGQESMKTAEQPYDMPGRTCFLEVDGTVYRTYSVYARGLESTGGSYYFLDLTALGRQEDWEQPAGRTASARGNQPDFSSVAAASCRRADLAPGRCARAGRRRLLPGPVGADAGIWVR